MKDSIAAVLVVVAVLVIVATVNWRTWFPVAREVQSCPIWMHEDREGGGSTYLCLLDKDHRGGHEYLYQNRTLTVYDARMREK